MTNCPSGKFSIGPRSASRLLEIREGGEHHEAEHRDRDDRADRGAESDRRRLEEPRAGVGRERRGSRCGRRRRASSATARVSGSISGTSPRTSRVTSRAQRTPNTSARTAPITATIQLMTSPSSRQATPTAKPIGQRLGPGRWWVSWPLSLKSGPAGDSIAPSVAPVNDVTTVATRGILHFAEDACLRDPVLGPAARSRGRGSRRDMTISSGQGRASSSGSLCVASMPSLPP